VTIVVCLHVYPSQAETAHTYEGPPSKGDIAIHEDEREVWSEQLVAAGSQQIGQVVQFDLDTAAGGEEDDVEKLQTDLTN